MGYEVTFKLNRDRTKTTVTSDVKVIQNHLSSFINPSKFNSNQTKIIGFDADWVVSNSNQNEPFTKSKCTTIQLCDGNSCLIILLNNSPTFDGSTFDSVQKSLLNFLSLPNVTFVGVGIKENVAKLEKIYGFGIRNAVELGSLAASVMKKPSLSYCGVDELAFAVNGFDIGKHKSVSKVYNYVRYLISEELAKVAAVNVYSYHKIGTKLLQSNKCYFRYMYLIMLFIFILVVIAAAEKIKI